MACLWGHYSLRKLAICAEICLLHKLKQNACFRHKRTWQAALSRLKDVQLEFALKFDCPGRNHAGTICARNSRGRTPRRRRSWRRVCHRDRACPKVPVFGPVCIFLFRQLKVINEEIGLNNAPLKIFAIRQWTIKSILSAGS
jgi:hypothetical protein